MFIVKVKLGNNNIIGLYHSGLYAIQIFYGLTHRAPLEQGLAADPKKHRTRNNFTINILIIAAEYLF